jgi:heptaprenyl diphosphate synthase
MNDFWKDAPEIAARLESVRSLMERTVRTPSFPLGEAVAEMIDSRGKMLRPALIVIGSRFGRSADAERIDSLGAGIELLHVATLIHDDIIDEAAVRRGIPAIHTRFGTKEAVLAGDWLLSRCFQLAARSAEPANAQALARLVGAICAAEIEQDLGKYKYHSSVRRYLRTITGKTAALFALALNAGAAEAKAPAKVVQTLRRAGYNVGMAFQVIDDILDFESSEGVMRKPVGKDLMEGLCTLPLIYALMSDRGSFAGLLDRQPLDEGRVADIISAVARLGGIERARTLARRFTTRSLSEIGCLPEGKARDELAGLAEKLLHRQY